MAQQVWTFYDRAGTFHTFGIYHNEDSGHFLAYLDNKIMIIDFNIKDNKEYSFYFEEELLHVKLISGTEGFEYELVNDLSAKTPLNVRLEKEKKQETHILVLIILIILLLGYTIYSFSKK